MDEQPFGGMLRGLSDAVDKLVPSRSTKLNTASKEHLEQLRALLLFKGEETGLPSDLRAAWLELIDLSLTENPDPAKMSAVFQKLQKLEPPLPGNGKAIGIDAIRAGLL